MNIILCGLPMSGKTTIGKLLAEKLEWNFVDTDRLIENAYGAKTCRQIFLDEGEKVFREIEKQQIDSLKESQKSVIAVGGGSLNDPDNVRMLQSIGQFVYLRTPVHVLWERIRSRGIPAYLDPSDPEKALYVIAEKRVPIYEAAANSIIETDGLNEQQIVNALYAKIKM